MSSLPQPHPLFLLCLSCLWNTCPIFTFFLYFLPWSIIPPPPPLPGGVQSTLLVSEASVTDRAFLSSANADALSPSVVGPLMPPTNINTSACCVVVCYISVLSLFHHLYFLGLVYFIESSCFYITCFGYLQCYYYKPL